MEVILYTTGCPKCKVLEKKLGSKGVQYSVISNEEEIVSTGFLSLPILKVDDTFMSFTEAVSWVNGVNV